MSGGQNVAHPLHRAVRAWSNAPLAWAAAAFASGIWVGGRMHAAPYVWGSTATLLVCCAVIAVARQRARLAYLASIFALMGAGAFTQILAPVTRLTVPPE